MKPELNIARVDVRAIDIGYFNTKYALGRKMVGGGAELAVGSFPSLAPRLTRSVGLTNTGDAGDGITVEVGGNTYFTGKGAQYHVSAREARPVLPDFSGSDRYYSLFLGALYYITKDTGPVDHLTIEDLVVGLPLTTFREQRQALVSKLSGEHVIQSPFFPKGQVGIACERVHCVVQPQGALANFSVANGGGTALQGWTLVIDAGGGTLDWFMSRNRAPSWERSGSHPQCMLAVATAVADAINPDWRNHAEILDRIDHAIRLDAESFTLGGKTYPLAAYKAKINSVLAESVGVMLATVGPIDTVDHILLTGGGAGVYQKYLAQHHPDLARLAHRDPDSIFSNVRGFHLYGEIVHTSRQVR